MAAQLIATFFSGAPAKSSRILADHSTTKPQLAGFSGATSIPAACSASTQPPSQPSRGQDAPPSANTAAPGLTLSSPERPAQRAVLAEEADEARPGFQLDAEFAEAHIPRLGWVAFDPTISICADQRYVRVVVGFDGQDGAFVRSAQASAR